MVGLDGLGMEYIEPGAADTARRQCVDQRRLVDEGAPRDVDEDRARLDAGDAGGVEEAAGLVGE